MATAATNLNRSLPSAGGPRVVPSMSPKLATGNTAPKLAFASRLPAPAPADPVTLLARNNAAIRKIDYLGGDQLFCQGEEGRAVFYVQKGRVKVTTVSKSGKEAVLSILHAGDFVGEGCVANQPVRTVTATALTNTTVLSIPKQEMMRVLHQERHFSDFFINYMLTRSSRFEEDLTDQLFNSCEKRLARALLRLAGQNEDGTPKGAIPTVNQETLAAMIGTTRSRVNLFMNKFRKLGFIEYSDMLKIHSSLLEVVQHD